MKFMKIFYIIITILFFSCKERKDELLKENIHKLELTFNNLDSIVLNENSSNFFMLSQEIELDKAEYLIQINPFPTEPNKIFFNSIKNSDLSFVLDFDIEGPNGVGNMSEFFFHNFDSIFIFDKYSYRVSLVDSSGLIMRKYLLRDVSGTKPNENTVMTWLSNKSKPFLINNNLYIPTLPDVDPFYSDYSKENLLMELDLKSGKFNLMLGYPTKYREGGYWGGSDHILPSIAQSVNDNKLIISYPIEDSIFSFDIASNVLSPIFLLKSKLFSEINPSSIFLSEREDLLKFQLGTDYYFSLLSDPYRNLYYRITNKKYSEESIQNILNRKAGNPNTKSLLIFDSKFKQIREFDLPEKFSSYMFFVFKSGVYVVIDNKFEDKIYLYDITSF